MVTIAVKTYPPTPERRAEVMARDGNRCVLCGSTRDINVDHILPRRLGGLSARSNLVTMCITTNTEKGDGVDYVLMQLLARYVQSLEPGEETVVVPLSPEVCAQGRLARRTRKQNRLLKSAEYRRKVAERASTTPSGGSGARPA